MLGVYDFLEHLCSRYPDLLLEGCSGGGGRFDAGMLYYSPQIWCSDNTEPYRAATQDSESAAQFRSLTDYSDGMTELLNSYPDVTSSLLHRVEAAGGSGITIQFTDYNASTGELLFNANSSQVIDIPAYIRSLQNCGVFSTVSYTGYKADDDGYSIDLRCVLAAPQQ